MYFLDIFSKNTKMSNFMIILSVDAELFHVKRQTGGQTDRETDMSKLIIAFLQFCDRA